MRFFLDETDLNMRLAKGGFTTKIVPNAEVHHGFAESARRGPDRVPKDLFDIGASWAVFQRKFIPEANWRRHRKDIERNERARLARHMITGGLEPRDVRRLMSTLRKGFKDGGTRPVSEHSVPDTPVQPFAVFPSAKREGRTLIRHWLRRKKARRDAEALARDGHIVTLVLLSRTFLRHRVRFDPRGFWEQTGGVYGKSDRDSRPQRLTTLKSRAMREINRVADVRGLSFENNI